MSSDQWGNSDLWETVDRFRVELQRLREERQRLLAVNTELLDALKGYQNWDDPLEARKNRAIAAIAHAEGGSQ